VISRSIHSPLVSSPEAKIDCRRAVRWRPALRRFAAVSGGSAAVER